MSPSPLVPEGAFDGLPTPTAVRRSATRGQPAQFQLSGQVSWSQILAAADRLRAELPDDLLVIVSPGSGLARSPLLKALRLVDEADGLRLRDQLQALVAEFREISNGGQAHYRAELAQLATTHRARRRPRPQAAARSISDLDLTATAPFITDLTRALIETGLPRTAAGVMACLLTSETGSRTAAELARHLQVSPATVSLAVGLLREQGLIRRGRDDRSRRHRYFIDEDAGFRSAMVGVRANQRLAATALRGADIFGAGTVTGARLATAGHFLEQLGNDIMRSAEEHWRAAIDTGLTGPQEEYASTASPRGLRQDDVSERDRTAGSGLPVENVRSSA